MAYEVASALEAPLDIVEQVSDQEVVRLLDAANEASSCGKATDGALESIPQQGRQV